MQVCPAVIQRILCPTDFSETSAHAIAHATAIARWYGASLTVLHVYDAILASIPGLPTRLDEIPESELSRVHEKMLTSCAAATAAGVRVEAAVAMGDAAAAILDRAARVKADLIVIGTHGLSGFEHLMLGSVAEKVLRKAGCTVLTVPPHAEPPPLPFKRILCAVDFSDWSLRALGLARSLAKESGAGLTIMTVIEWPWEETSAPVFTDLPEAQAAALAEFRRYAEETALRRLKSLCEEERGGMAETRLSHGKAAARIVETASHIGADLIVLGVHGRKTLDIGIFGSTANQVIRHARCGVVTFRSEA